MGVCSVLEALPGSREALGSVSSTVKGAVEKGIHGYCRQEQQSGQGWTCSVAPNLEERRMEKTSPAGECSPVII